MHFSFHVFPFLFNKTCSVPKNPASVIKVLELDELHVNLLKD